MSSSFAEGWSTARLVEACLGGSQEAWDALLDRYKNLIYSIPIRFGAPPQDAADIFQAVCVDLFNELGRLRNVDALQAWLIRVATHKCYHWKKQKNARPEACMDEELVERQADSRVQADLIAEIEREQLVRDAILQLPPRCRRMIELLFFEQPPLPYSVVADRLGLAKGSIGFVRGRCLKKLKRILEAKKF